MRKLKFLALVAFILAGLGARPMAKAQGYTDAFLSSVNFNDTYPCGNSATTPTAQIQLALQTAAYYGGGTVDLTCYQGPVTLTADVFSPITKHIMLILPAHIVTVQANATIPINFTLIYSNGSGIAAGPAFTITDNSLAFRSPNGYQYLDPGVSAAPALTPSNGGSLTLLATYYYVVTSLPASGGETQGSAEAHVTLTGTQATIALTWTADPNAATYRIYRGTTSGGENVYYTSATNSFTDTGGSGTAGTPPAINSAWIPIVSGGIGSGTVTSFSATALSPLFTSSVATPTTTPALSFTLSNAGAYTVLTNDTVGAAAPAYGKLDLANVVAGALGIGNGGTGATSLAAANIPVFTGAITTGHCAYWASATSEGDSGAPCGTGSGTVTSVGGSFTGGLISVGGSPITNSGTLALTVAGTSGGIPYFSSAAAWASSGALANHGILFGGGAGGAPTASSAGTTGQGTYSGGASANGAYADQVNPPMIIPAANCNNATAGAGWSLPTSGAPTPACRTGTNVQAGVLQFAASNSAQFQVDIPGNWDSASTVYAKIYLTQAANTTASQTIIMQMATGCSSTTDDPAFNTAQAFGTATTTGTANTPFTETNTSVTMTGCAAGGNLNVKISRSGSDSATTSPNVYWVSLTFQTVNTAGAN